MVVLVACDPGIQEAESGGSLGIPGESELQEQAPALSGLQYETVSCADSEWV